MNTPLPSIGPHPADQMNDFAGNYRALEQRVIVAENEARDLNNDLKTAHAEIGMLRDQLKEATDEAERLRRHGHEVRGRAEAVGEAVIQLIKKSSSEAAKPLVPKPGEEQRTAMTPEQEEAFVREALAKPQVAFSVTSSRLPQTQF